MNSLHSIRLIALAALGSSSALTHGLSPALAERADTTTNVEFPAGSSARRLTGQIKGDQRAPFHPCSLKEFAGSSIGL